MPGPFDMQQQFPIAAVIDAIQKKAVYENQMQQQQRQDLLQGIQGAAQGAQSVGDARRRLAAAMTMSQNPSVQQALGAGQAIPGSGTLNAPANQQLTTGPGGQPVTPGMTAMGGAGMAPIPNTPQQVTPPLTPQQIEPLLGRQSQDYLGDIQKASNLARLQAAFQGKGNVVTPIINQDGTISWGQTQVQPGSTVQRPTRMPSANAGRSGGMTASQRRIAQMQTQYATLSKQMESAYGPARDAIAQQMAPLKAQIDQGLEVPSGTPGANTTTAAPMIQPPAGASGGQIDPNVKALLDQHGVRYSQANIAWAQQQLAKMGNDANSQQ